MLNLLTGVQMLGELILVHIRQLFEWVLPPCLRFVRKSVKEIQPSLDTSLAQACMRLFSSLLDEFRPSGADEAPVPPKGKPTLPSLLHPWHSPATALPQTRFSPVAVLPQAHFSPATAQLPTAFAVYSAFPCHSIDCVFIA